MVGSSIWAPIGEQGPPGPPGPPGLQGPQGPTGGPGPDAAAFAQFMLDLASQIDATKGSNLVGFLQAGTGAVGRTLLAKVRDTVNVLDFGVVGDGITDDTAKIQACLDAHLNVDFGTANKIFLISGELNLRAGHILNGKGCQIKQTGIRQATFAINTKTLGEIFGFRFIGLGTDFNNSPSSRAVAVRGISAVGWKVHHNYMVNHTCAGVFFDFSSDCNVHHNQIVGPGAGVITSTALGACYGVVLDGDRMSANDNFISQTAQGVATGDSKRNISIQNNAIFAIVGQHGIYAGANLINLVITGNNISNIALIGIKVQNYDTSSTPGDSTNVIVSNNNVYSTGSQGIAVLNTTVNATRKTNNVTVTGNTVRVAGESGINLGDIVVGLVSNNSLYGCGSEGISFARINTVQITNNTIMEIARNGLVETGASTNCTIANNLIKNCGYAAAVGAKNGILIQLGDTFLIDGNIIIDNTTKMQYGLFISGGDQTSMIVKNNVARGMTEHGARFKSPTESMLLYAGNVFLGTLGSTFNLPAANQRGDASREFFSTSVPTTGTWEQGDIVRNRFPAASGFMGWVCVVAGTPGTWKTYGPVTA